jgi:hypothetical protein
MQIMVKKVIELAWGGFYKKPKTENRPEKTEWTVFFKKYVRKS